MKNKKGFTLVELIAVIAILAVILTIGGISIVNVRQKVTEKDYDNLVTTIKIAAESYHEETGIEIVPVNILLQTGKLQADSTDYENLDEGIHKGDPVIFNPVDGSPFNCAAVMFENGKVKEFDPKKGCSTEAIAANALNILVYVGDTKVDYDTSGANHNDWIKPLDSTGNLQKVTLKTSIDGIVKNNTDVSYIWTNPLNPDKSYTGSEFEIEVPEVNYYEQTINLTVKVDKKVLSKDFLIKIDAKKPTVSDVYVSNQNEWAASKTISGILVDNESKLYGYKIIHGETAICTDSDWITLAENTTSTDFSQVVKANSDYYKVCVKDNAGYISETASYIKIDKIDNVGPELSLSITNGKKYLQSNKATVTITDKGSDGVNVRGFKNGQKVIVKYDWKNTTSTVACSSLTQSQTITFNEGDKTKSINIDVTGKTGAGKFYVCVSGDKITDGIGNSTDVLITSKEMYLDNEAPTAALSIASKKSYNSTSATYTISNLSDNGSGATSMCISKLNTTDNCSWVTAANVSKRDITASGTDGNGTKTTFYLFIKDAAGNIATITKDYTLYSTCSSTYSSTSSSYCSASCGYGTASYTTYYYDTYFGTSCGSNSGSESCYAGSCPDPDPPRSSGGGSSGGGSSCDTTCQMQKNSAAWHDCTSQSCRDDLHAKNEELAKGNSDCGSSCTFNSNGSWYDSKGNKLY